MKAIVLFVASLCSMIALAQAPSAPSAQKEQAKGGEITGGYSFVHSEGATMHGFAVGLQGQISRYTSGVFDFGTYFPEGGGQYFTYTGGPQFELRKYRTQPFVRGLIGGATSSYEGTSTSHFVAGGGGGVAFKTSTNLAVRTRVDYLRLFTDYGDANMLVFEAGLQYHFKVSNPMDF